MNRTFQAVGICAVLVALFVAPRTSAAAIEAQQQIYYRGEVLSLTQGTDSENQEVASLNVRLETDDVDGKVITIVQDPNDKTIQDLNLESGDRIVVIESHDSATSVSTYYVSDRYRIPSLVWIGVLFFVVVLVFTRKRGLLSIMGLAVSLAILIWYVVPLISEGRSPFWVGLSGAVAIAVISMILAHGWKHGTRVALVGTLLTLVLAVGMSWAFVHAAHLLGVGSDEVYTLQFVFGDIELRGLLLAGILIATLGILDDVTTSLTASIQEIHRANAHLGTWELYRRGLVVGKEHIIALVNTLVLAYAGASLPLFLLFTVIEQPLWVTVNSEVIAEEIIRTLVGSLTLILAVPITAAIAAKTYAGRSPADPH